MKDIYYAGVSDPSCTLFENQYPTPKGMSYNSYVIRDSVNVVTDAVDSHCIDRWLTNVEAILEGREPDYLVVHHIEPDHSAGIGEALRRYQGMKVVTTAQAAKVFKQFYPQTDIDNRLRIVTEGEVIETGHHSLQFFMAPMVHWPEVCVSYDRHTGTLFTADAFGRFGSLGYDDDWLCEARRYYCNIVGKYGTQVRSLLGKVKGLDVKSIAPLHGPVLTGDLTPYIEAYDRWSSYTPETDGVLVAYASVYGHTAQVALRLADMLTARGVTAVPYDICRQDLSEAVAQAFRLSKIVLASITYDAGIFSPMQDFVMRLKKKGLSRRTFAVISNGSWAPAAGRLLADEIAGLKDCTIISPDITLRSEATGETYAALHALADALV